MTDSIQRSFSSGEWSPLLDGRSDLEKYYSACRVLENMISTRYGPAVRRPGLYFVAEIKDSTKKARLLPFKYSTEQAYILEVGEEYIRFCKDRGQIMTGSGESDFSSDGANLDNIVAHWLLDDNTASTLVRDDNGEVHNGATTTYDTEDLHKTGKVGTGCLMLSGVEAVEITNNVAFNFGDGTDDTAFSITAWIYVTHTGARQVIFSKWKSGVDRQYRFSLDNSRCLELALCDDSVSIAGDLVAQWKLNEDAANTEVHDDTTAGVYQDPHDGISTANTEDMHKTGKTGSGCFDFDGQYAVEIADHAELSFDDSNDEPFSIAAWVYVKTSGGIDVIISKWDTDKREWQFYIDEYGRLKFELYDDTENKYMWIRSNVVLTSGWHFVVGTCDGSGGSGTHYGLGIFVDGATPRSYSSSKEPGYTAMRDLGADVAIGARYSSGALARFFNERIDNVMLFAKELTYKDQRSLYNDGIGAEEIETNHPRKVSDDALTIGWHFVACTYPGQTTEHLTAASLIKLYVDGALVDATAHEQTLTGAQYEAMEVTTIKPRIGAQINKSGNLSSIFADKIDEVAVFSDVLTATEIASLYTSAACELESPYEEDDLYGLQRIQSADVMYAFHRNYNPRKLMRYAHDEWELESIDFDWPPFMDENKTDTTISVTGTAPFALNSIVTLNASAAIFTSNHVGSFWLLKHERLADSTNNPQQIRTGFTAVSQTSSTLHDVEGTWHFLTAGTWTGAVVVDRRYPNEDWHTVAGPYESTNDQNFDVSGIEELGEARYRMRSLAAPTWGGTCNATISVERPYHYGIVKIDSFVNAVKVTGKVIREIQNEAATKFWSEGAWSDERGYPSCGVFHEERLMCAGSTYEPHRVHGSMTYDWENFKPGTLDDFGVKYDTNAGEMNAVQWLISKEILLMGTAGAEWKLGAFDTDEPLTPGNPIKPRMQTTHGSKNIQAIMLSNVVLFVQGGQSEDAPGRVVRGAQYVFEKGESGGYDAPDYTILSEHITESGIVSMAYQKQPEPVLWCVLDNGYLIGMTFEPGQKIWGWFRVVTDGLFEDVAVIPGESEDEVWVIVNRTIEGETKRYIEYFKPRDWGASQRDCFFVDSGLSFEGGALKTITGITLADPCVVTAANNFTDGQQIIIKSVTGTTELNYKVFSVSNPTSDNFELRDKTDSVDIDSTGFTEYVSGGTARVVDNTFSGLDHLEGETVSVLGDGTVHADVVVTDGAVTLTDYFNKVQIGLPYDSDLMPMKVDFPASPVKGKIKRTHKAVFSFQDSLGCTFGGLDEDGEPDLTETIPFRKTTDDMGEAVPLFTGEKIATFPGRYGLEGNMYVRQSQPLPLTVRSIIQKMKLYDG